MESVTELPTEACTACQRLAEVLYRRHGDHICGGCEAVFEVAELLYRVGVTDEDEIIGTLAYASRYGERALVMPDDFAAKHPRFDVTRRIEGVPILRPKRVAVRVERYPGYKLPKLVRIEVLSKFATRKEISELYREVLQREALPVFKGSFGSVSWVHWPKRLIVNVGPGEHIEERLLDQLVG